MYDRSLLLKDCQRLVKDLERDIRARVGADAALTATTTARYQEAVTAKQTSMTSGVWLTEQVTQAAVAWVLATVFVRFCEDNGLIDQAWIAGPGDADPVKNRMRLSELAREAYIVEHPSDTDVQYLQASFRAFGAFPATRDLVAADRNPMWTLPVSAQGARAIIAFWRETDRAGALIRDLRIADIADTRWLGDLYQDLSADARKRYALLQTPDFVEEFILDYTLTPAIATFGLVGLRGIDPTCGSGHFLLGMFKRLTKAWVEQLGPAGEVKEAVSRAMQSIYGIDLNPFAVAISRFRLMLAGLAACNLRRLRDCPAFGFTLAVGNTLTLGEGSGFQENWQAEHGQDIPDFLIPGEYVNAKRVLSQQYHVVVGNPPYIAVKDAAERERIKQHGYASCFQKWTLSVPFTERFWTLTQNAKDPKTGATRDPGFVGLINSNNFTKREFGKALIEQVLPSLDLTHVIDTSGCYIPGHGTPTVILFGRNQAPAAHRPVRAVQGIRGEPGRPEIAANGKVWNAMVENIGRSGAETPWLSVADVERKVFGQHPWSLGGGGASELKAVVEGNFKTVTDLADAVGITTVNGEDDLYTFDRASIPKRFQIEQTIQLATGDALRDWGHDPFLIAVWLYDADIQLKKPTDMPRAMRYLWLGKSIIRLRRRFGTPMVERGLTWYEWQETYPNKLKTPLTITFGEVATHNHFVLCRGGVVFKQTAPVIKLSAEATEDDHLALMSCLNSSTAAFWYRQVCFPKGGDRTSDGARVSEEQWNRHLAHNSTNIEKTPIPGALRHERITITRRLDALGQELAALQPSRLLASQAPTRQLLDQTAARVAAIRAEMIFLQEELDWLIYRAYSILTEAECPLYVGGIVPLVLGERAFEIDVARKVAAEEEETSWFERHRSTPITDIPARWPEGYRQVVQRRLDLIASHPHIGLLEKPEHKRRWQTDPWDEVINSGLRDWLCDQLEDRLLWPDEPHLTTAQEIADRFFARPDVQIAAELYRGSDIFDRVLLVGELLTVESVPYVPALRYSEEGLIKRADWEAVWDLQRKEDRGESVGKIPVPPRYARADFQSEIYWSHRGKLDVPKERFISYPGAERDPDQTLVVLWAGYDHAQQARALIEHYQWAKSAAGWDAPRLTPLLVGLDQLIPWIKQWHNELDPVHGSRLGDVYAEFLAGELQDLGLTIAAARAWRPVRQAGRRGRRRAAEQGAQ